MDDITILFNPFSMFLKMHLLLPSPLCLQNPPAAATREKPVQTALQLQVSIEIKGAVYNPGKNNNNEPHCEDSSYNIACAGI